MLTLISKLQRKPERVRRKLAVVISAVMTGIIVLFWLISLGSSFDEAASKAALTEEDNGPFEALSEGFGDFFADTAETLQTAAGAFSGLSNEASAVTEETPAAPVSE